MPNSKLINTNIKPQTFFYNPKALNFKALKYTTFCTKYLKVT